MPANRVPGGLWIGTHPGKRLGILRRHQVKWSGTCDNLKLFHAGGGTNHKPVVPVGKRMRSGCNVVIVRKCIWEDKAHHPVWLNIVDVNERLLIDGEHYLGVFSDDITWFVRPDVDRE